MEFAVVGVNYKNTSIDVRENVFLDRHEVEIFTKTARKILKLKDILVLSTCNRTEIYFKADLTKHAGPRLWQLLMDQKNIPSCPVLLYRQSKSRIMSFYHNPKLKPLSFYYYTKIKAVKHLLRVASSLDSLVVGESQILGQVKKSLETAAELNSLSAEFLRTFEFAVHAAKKVRTKTGIAEHYTSVGHVAVDLAKSIFTDLKTKKSLVIGAGEVASLVITYLKQIGADKTTVTNRTLSRSLHLSQQLNADVLPFDLINSGLESADIVISSVSNKQLLFSFDMIKAAMEERKYRTLFLLDLGMPRNIDAKVQQIDNVYLFNIDDLVQVANKNLKLRLKEKKLADDILAEETSNYQNWLNTFDERRSISEFRNRFVKIYFGQLKKDVLNLDICAEDKNKLLSSIYKTSQKILHPLTSHIKDNKEGSDALINTIYQSLKLPLRGDLTKADSAKIDHSKIIKLSSNDQIKSG